jgi:hypothetical protein
MSFHVRSEHDERQRTPTVALAQLIAQEQDEGRSNTLRWVLCDDTKRVVEAERAVALPAFAVARMFIDPTVCDGDTAAAAVSAFALGCLPTDLTAAASLRRVRGALAGLPVTKQHEVQRLLAVLVDGLAELAQKISESGAPIEPGHPPELVVLAQLCVFGAEGWDRAERGEFIFAGPSMIRPDGRGAIHRDGRGERGRNRADRIAAYIRQEQPDYRGDRLKDEGGRPKGSLGMGSESALLRMHLPAVLEQFPDATVAELRQWTGMPNSPGVKLRTLMHGQSGLPPSADAIRRARRAIGASIARPSRGR